MNDINHNSQYIPSKQLNHFSSDEFPSVIKEAILEVQKNAQAPDYLVIASALGAVSLACQNEIDVRNLSGSISPCSLFFLTIAESGDRKSTVDKLFTSPISEFEEEYRKEYSNQLVLHKSKMDIWSACRKKILSSIKNITGKDEYVLKELEEDLYRHDLTKPVPPRAKRLLYSNATPEAIVDGLYRNWPSAGIMSDEAGGVLNGHAMNDLGMLNQIWDGSILNVDRKSSESFTIKDARLTISLMTQEGSLRRFMERRDGLARGIGFFARCLVYQPPSLQGYRSNVDFLFKSYNKLDLFKNRLKTILNRSLEEQSNPWYKRRVLELSKEARDSCIIFNQKIEHDLLRGGYLYGARDAASKMADNAVRMAALFHWFEGKPGDISVESMISAQNLCEAYLHEFNRLFGEYGIFSEIKKDADKLFDWLKEHEADADENSWFKKNFVRQYGPLRNTEKLNKAIKCLENQDLIIYMPRNGAECITVKVGRIKAMGLI